MPGVIVSPWVDEGIVVNEEHRHTSLLATLRRVWDLGDPFTDRDAAARSFDHLLSREIPRDPATWPEMHPKPLPDWQLTKVAYGEAISTLGKAIGPGLIEHARQSGHPLPAELTDPDHPPTPRSRPMLLTESTELLLPPGLVPSEPHRVPRTAFSPRHGLGVTPRRRIPHWQAMPEEGLEPPTRGL